MNPENNLSTVSEEIATKHPVFLVTRISKYLAMLLFVIMPFIGGWIGYQHAAGRVVEVEKSIIGNTPVEIGDATSEQKYKETFLGGEIPFDWSELSVSETIVQKGELPNLSNVRYSIAPGTITFGDGAWEQVDFYFLGEGVAEELISKANQEDGVQISESTLGGRPAVIIQYPLDNNEVTKAGTGGLDYIIDIPEDQIHHSNHPTHLLINKWALGDKFFEENFKHYLETADFKDANSVAEVKPATEEPTYMIESGEILISLKDKTFEATVMFGLADVTTVKGEYSEREDILIEVLEAVRNTGRNAGYVDENRITVIEVD